MNDLTLITITKAEYDKLKRFENLFELYRETLKRCAVYSEWRKNGVSFDEEKIMDTITIFDTVWATIIKDECKRQKEAKEREKAKERENAEKPSFPEIKKED